MNQLQLDFECHLQRVRSKTQEAIATFFDRLADGETFHAQELRDFVASQVPVAPSSPDRVMRAMRLDGVIRYEVVNRRESLYRKLG